MIYVHIVKGFHLIKLIKTFIEMKSSKEGGEVKRERLVKGFSYKTNKASEVPWHNLLTTVDKFQLYSTVNWKVFSRTQKICPLFGYSVFLRSKM